jgi:PPOX class probable F420-dependent enzyme
VDIHEFDKNQYLSLATFRKSGVAVETPVWFAALGDKLYVFTAGNSGKVKRLRNSPAARIAPCDGRGRLRGPSRETQARIIADPAIVAQAIAALRKKYGWLALITDFAARVSGRYQKRAYLEIDY